MDGTIYQNGNRWWWKVRLPGQEKISFLPLKPVGSKYATKDRVVAEEVARNLYQNAMLSKGRPQVTITLKDIIAAYNSHCQVYYQNSKEAENICRAMNLLADCDIRFAEDFGPLALEKIRDKMIANKLARSTINKRIGMIKRMFRWAASKQMIPISCYQSIATLENLHAGRSEAKETKPVTVVPWEDVKAVLPHLNATGKAMVQLQWLTGMRSDELCTMRPCDIDRSDKKVWIYRPQTHKEAFRGHKRFVTIGPKAQAILRPFLIRKADTYCFTPAEEHGQNRNYQPRYDSYSYRRMIVHAQEIGGIRHWFPHQLRHSAGTNVRKLLGREAARAFLSHRNPKVTDDYAEIDMNLAKEAAEKLG